MECLQNLIDSLLDIPLLSFILCIRNTFLGFFPIFILRCFLQLQVALCGSFLGVVFGSGFIISVLNLYSLRIFGFYVLALSFFHYSEYFSTAATNPTSLSLDSYLLNHSISYWVAASASWIEFFLELWLCPSIKQLWYISAVGGVLCVFGEITRKVAMFTAERNFNHMVQVKRQSGHKLVTHGIYSFFRHPSYVGWFWWSIGTQVLLVNPVCAAFYTAASWTFFKERVRFEEMTLINFFDEEYINYQKSVPTGLPFIKGYLTESN